MAGNRREKEAAELPTQYLVTPYGTTIKVPRRRAEALLARHPIEIPGGKTAGWTVADEGARRKHKDPIEDAETAGTRLVRTEPTVEPVTPGKGAARG